jgi:chemotaxis signal transduction protein
MTDDLLPPLPEPGFDLPVPDWMAGLPDLPFPAAPVAPALTNLPLPAVTPPPRSVAALAVPSIVPDDRAVLAPAHVVVEDDGGTLCFHTTLTVPAGGWDEARVVFHMPPGVRRAVANRKPKVSAKQVVWSLGKLPAGASVPLILRVANGPHLTAAAARPPAFEVTFTRPECSTRPASGGSETTPTLGACGALQPDLASVVPTPPVAEVLPPPVVEASLPDAFDLDAAVPFRLTVTNTAGRPRRTVTMTVAVPAELEYESSDGEYRPESRQVEWRVNELDPGERQSVTVWLKATLPGPVRVTATVTDATGPVVATADGVCELTAAESSVSLLELMRDLDLGDATDLTPERTKATGERHVLFRLGDGAYAAPIAQLREIVRPPAVTPVPGAPDWLLGLANVRGDAMSIVDLPSVLGLAGDGTKRSVLVAQTADGQTAVGLAVDEVIGLRRLTPNPWSADDAADAGRLGEFLAGLSEHHDRLAPVLDLDRVLRSDVLASFGAA